MRRGGEQRLEFQLFGTQHLADDFAVAVAQVDYAQFAFHARHVFDDFVRLLFANREIVMRCVEGANDVDECVHRERVMLARYGETRRGLGVVFIALFEQLRLLEHLASVPKKRLAFVGGDNTLACALEHGDAHFALKISD